MAKINAILLLVKLISEKKSSYINTFNKKDLTSIDEEISNKNQTTEMPNINYITSESQ